MKIAFIGAGNVASFFSLKMQHAGHEIVQIISLTLSHAAELAAHFHCTFSNNIKDLTLDADAYIIATNDDSVKAYAKTLRLSDKIIIHTAGSISLADIQPISKNTGSIWCMQSIQKNNFPTNHNIPTYINYNTPKAAEVITTLASCISEQITFCEDEKKLALHLSAVIANNFTNHLYTIIEKLLSEHELPFEAVLPIIEQTTQQLKTKLPFNTQTGPAIRNDQTVIQKHLEKLSTHPSWEKIYEVITASIQNMYQQP